MDNIELTQSEELLKKVLVQTGKIKNDISNISFRELIESTREYINRLADIELSLEIQSDLYSTIKSKIDTFGAAIVSTISKLKESNSIFIEQNNVINKNRDLVKQTKDLQLQLPSIYRTLNKLNEKLVENQQQLLTGNISSRDIAKDLNKLKANELALDLRIKDVNESIQVLESEKEGLGWEQQDQLTERQLILREIEKELSLQKLSQKSISDELESQLKSTKEIEKKIGIGGKILEGFKKIPVLGDILDIEDADQAMRVVAKNGASIFETMSAGAKALGPSIAAAMGPLLAITVAVKAFQSLVGLMFEADKRTTNLAKNLNISKESSQETQKSWNKIIKSISLYQNIEKGNLLTRNDLIESSIQINDLLGTSIDLTKNISEGGAEIVAQFAYALKYLKLSKEEQHGLLRLSNLFNKSIEGTQKVILGTTRLRKLESGIILDERKNLQDVLETHSSIALSIKGGIKELTLATSQAKELGLTLNQIDKIADSFLNFESSISSELEAELLTNRDLNFEQERFFALTNDIEGLTREIGNNQELINSFSNSNRITQAAIASTLGMSREEMAEMVMKQKELNIAKGKATFINDILLNQLKENGKINEKEFIRFKSGTANIEDYYKIAKTQNTELTELFSKQALESLRSTDAQQKFNESLDAAKQIFSNFVDGGTLERFAIWLTDITNSSLFGGAKSQQIENQSQDFKKSEKYENLSQEQKDDYERTVEKSKPLGFFSKTLYNLSATGLEETLSEAIRKVNEQKLENIHNSTNTAQDFISRPGQPIQKFRKDDIILGGTKLDNDENKINNLETSNNYKSIEKSIQNHPIFKNQDTNNNNQVNNQIHNQDINNQDYKSIEKIVQNNNKFIQTHNQNNIKNNTNSKLFSSSNNVFENDNSLLIQEFKDMKMILAKILNKEGNIYLDSQKLGTGINMSTYKITT